MYDCTSTKDWTIGSGWNFKNISFPTISPPNVPIPEVEPAETKGYWTVKISSASLIANTWCMADVFP